MSVRTGKTSEPLSNGENGREANGRFGKGNPGGPGNPFHGRVNKLRASFYQAVTPSGYLKAVRKCLKLAQAGDVAAFRELNDRLFGKPKQPLEVGGHDGGAVKVKHEFDHADFARRFAEYLCGGSAEPIRGRGCGVAPANGN